MTGNVISFDQANQMRRDREVFSKRLSGMSVRNIAHEYGVEVEDIHESMARMLGGVTPSMRLEMVSLELDRLDDLQTAYWQKAKDGSCEACALVLKMMERRARLLGIDKSPTDDAQFNEQIRNRERSTAAIDRGLNLLLGKRVVIEGEATHVPAADAGGDPNPDDAK